MTVWVTLASASSIKTMDLLKNKPGDFLKINNYSLINFEARALVTYPKSSLGSKLIMYSVGNRANNYVCIQIIFVW